MPEITNLTGEDATAFQGAINPYIDVWAADGGYDRSPVNSVVAPLATFDLRSSLPAGATFTRASTAPYISGTFQTAAINAPRFEVIDGQQQGLLYERSRIVILASNNPTTWSLSGLTRTPTQPDREGGTTAALFTGNGANGPHFLAISGGTPAGGGVYIPGVIVEPVSGVDRLQLIAGSETAMGLNAYANFRLTGGARVLATGAGVLNAGIEDLKDGSFLLWLAAPAIASGSGSVALTAILSDTAARLPNADGFTGSFLASFAQIEATNAANTNSATSFSTSARAADSLVLSVASQGLPDGAYVVRYTFNDGTTQDVPTTIASQAFTVPLNLYRRHIVQATVLGQKLIRGITSPSNVTERGAVNVATVTDTAAVPNWTGRVIQLAGGVTTCAIADVGRLEYEGEVGQSNALPSGSNNPTIFNTARFPHHALQFTAARGADGQTAVASGTLSALRPLTDDNANAGFPATYKAFLAQYWARYHGEDGPVILTRTDALGGTAITTLVKDQAATGTGKFFYANTQAAITAGKALAVAYGVDFSAKLSLVQGEDDSVLTDAYQNHLSRLIDDHNADCVTSIGRPLTAFLIHQTSGYADGSLASKNGPLAHLAESQLRRGTSTALVGPMYCYPLSEDVIHLGNVGRLMMGDLGNYAEREVRRNGHFTPLDIARSFTPALGVNQRIRSRGPAVTTGLSAGTKITALGTGTGGLGTYTVNNSQLLGSAAAPVKFAAMGAIFLGYISNGSGSAGTVLTVTRIFDGAQEIAINSATVTVKFNRSIRVDQDWVPSVGAALGFTWTDASSRTISSVAVEGDTVTITLSGAPTGATTLGYAIENCGSGDYRTGGATDTNWSATRGQIYHDTGIEAPAYRLGAYGTPTLRLYAPRMQIEF